MPAKKEGLFFLLRLNLFLIPLYVVETLRLEWQPLTALVSSIISALIPGSSVGNNIITFAVREGSFAMAIDWDCTGWKSMLFFLALVLAVKSDKRSKILGLAFLPAIFAVNILRIWSIAYALSVYGTGSFDMLHSVIWSFGSIAVVLAFWLLWMKIVHGKEYIRKRTSYIQRQFKNKCL